MELGIPYELIGADGTRIVVGNSDAAKADPDYVGWLDPDQGIAGLDSPEYADAGQALVQGHGGVNFDGFHGRRPIVINGIIRPDVSIDTIIALEEKIKRAANATDPADPAALAWTNSGMPRRRLLLNRQPGLRITGRRPKTFQIPMVDADYRVQAAAETDNGSNALNATDAITNAGTALATPRIRVTGPCPATIKLIHSTSGAKVQMKAGFSLAAGQILEVTIGPPWPTVTVDGADRYGDVDFLNTTWWGLDPGAQNVKVEPAGTGSWRLYHRDAWL